MGIFQTIVTSSLPLVPTPIMRRLSSRYIAGETLDEAMARTAKLVVRGFDAVLDILGEEVANEAAAREALEAYKCGSNAIQSAGIDSYVSVKPTHMGLRLSEDLSYELYAELLEHCAQHAQFVRVEMEDHTTTDATLRLFARLRERFERVGIVLQARLFRTAQDIANLPPASDVRVVKGIYLEAADIAHTERGPISQAFLDGARACFEAGHTVAFATHDGDLAQRCLGLVREFDVDKSHYYFEVLLGVRESLWEEWKAAGHQVRVYVPYGPDWRAYSTRRLGKNPEILGHVLRNMFRR